MNCRLFFVLLSVAIVAVKAGPGTAEGMWAKLAAKPLVTTPVKDPFHSLKAQSAVPQARSTPIKGTKNEHQKLQTAETPSKRTVEIPIVEDSVPKKLPQAPRKLVKEAPVKRKLEIPIFAKMILGDPENPKLASMEDLRKVDLRNVESELELPNKQTMPLVEELLEKSSNLLRLFQEIQEESNGFVEDIEKHNENVQNDYIGYYN